METSQVLCAPVIQLIASYIDHIFDLLRFATTCKLIYATCQGPRLNDARSRVKTAVEYRSDHSLGECLCHWTAQGDLDLVQFYLAREYNLEGCSITAAAHHRLNIIAYLAKLGTINADIIFGYCLDYHF